MGSDLQYFTSFVFKTGHRSIPKNGSTTSLWAHPPGDSFPLRNGTRDHHPPAATRKPATPRGESTPPHNAHSILRYVGTSPSSSFLSPKTRTSAADLNLLPGPHTTPDPPSPHPPPPLARPPPKTPTSRQHPPPTLAHFSFLSFDP